MQEVIFASNFSAVGEFESHNTDPTLKFEVRADDDMLIEDDVDHAFLRWIDYEVRGYYEELEWQRLSRLIDKPIFFSLASTEFRFGRKVILAIADRPDIVVDNEEGDIMIGSLFVARMRRDPNWDWRNLEPLKL